MAKSNYSFCFTLYKSTAYFLLCFLIMTSCKSEQKGNAADVSTSKNEQTASETQSKVYDVDEIQNTRIGEASSNVDLSQIESNIDPDRIDLDLVEELLHIEINKVRKTNQLPRLLKHPVLENAAVDQNEYVVNNQDLTHFQKSKKKETVKDRVYFYGGGFKIMAENLIYEGFTVRSINGVQSEIITPTYQELVKTMTKNWLESPGHRANIMEKDVDRVGTAIAYNPQNHAVYATQVFGKLR